MIPALAVVQASAATVDPAAAGFGGDPYRSHQWPDIRRAFFGGGSLRFDDRIAVRGPAFAEDPMNVPISVHVPPEVGEVERLVVVVDRNPIRKVLEYFPVDAAAAPGPVGASSTVGGSSAAVPGGIEPRALFMGQRLRVRVMHPMDTGLVGGIPAFYLSRLSVRHANDRELLRLHTYEPVSENPVFGSDFSRTVQALLRLVGVDNNGNRIDGAGLR